MALRRNLILRVMGLAFMSATLASLGAYVILMNTAITVSTAVVRPMLQAQFPMVRSQCEASPSTFSVQGPRRVRLYAYDLDSGLSANPQAPPLDQTLWQRIREGEEIASRLFWFQNEGGATVFRTGRPGGCALFQVRWLFSGDRRSSLMSGFALGHGILLGVAVILTLAFGVIPLLGRIRQLARSALLVGDAHKYATTQVPADDELGVIVASLDSAHARIVAGEQARQHQQQILLDHLADLSHDVMAPLSALQLLLEALRSSTTLHATADQECVQDASEEVEYLGALIANLSMAVQLREGLPPFDPRERVDVRGCIERVCQRMRFMAKTRGMALEGAWPDEPVSICGSSLVLERVISNLVMNAIAHGESGGHVAVFVQREETDRFALVVLDDGPGVPPAVLPRLTERRFRAVQDSPHQGSGLGLAIVGEVCVKAGWNLSLDAEHPRGLRVTITGQVASSSP